MSFVPIPALAKIALLVLAGLAAAGALRGTPARARHDLWLLVIAGTVVIALAGLFLPALFFGVPPSLVPLAAPPSTRVILFVALAWAAGALVGAWRLVRGLALLRRIGRDAMPLSRSDAAEALAGARRSAGVKRPVTLLVSADVRVPATWGVRRAVIALPAAAGRWSAERLRVVLLHELLHVRRRDVLVELALEVVNIVFWFHPAVWLAARQLRLERERTCDEAVIGTGARPTDYCAHLVEIMRAAARGNGVVVAAGMAAPSTLEYRVRALLAEPAGAGGAGNKPRRLRLRALVLAAAALAIYALGILTPCAHIG